MCSPKGTPAQLRPGRRSAAQGKLQRQPRPTHPWSPATDTFAMSVAGAADGLNDVYDALDAYHWDDDVEFQSGLSAILGSATGEQAAELTLRARCFYYAR